MKKIIKGVDLIVNSAEKLGRHIPQVSSGCGRHKSLKDYTRKGKKRKRYLYEYNKEQ